MRTPEQNYYSNPEFKALVDYMENAIHHFQYSPSEMREAAMLACVHFEMKRPPRGMCQTFEDVRRDAPGTGEGER